MSAWTPLVEDSAPSRQMSSDLGEVDELDEELPIPSQASRRLGPRTEAPKRNQVHRPPLTMRPPLPIRPVRSLPTRPPLPTKTPEPPPTRRSARKVLPPAKRSAPPEGAGSSSETGFEARQAQEGGSGREAETPSNGAALVGNSGTALEIAVPKREPLNVWETGEHAFGKRNSLLPVRRVARSQSASIGHEEVEIDPRTVNPPAPVMHLAGMFPSLPRAAALRSLTSHLNEIANPKNQEPGSHSPQLPSKADREVQTEPNREGREAVQAEGPDQRVGESQEERGDAGEATRRPLTPTTVSSYVTSGVCYSEHTSIAGIQDYCVSPAARYALDIFRDTYTSSSRMSSSVQNSFMATIKDNERYFDHLESANTRQYERRKAELESQLKGLESQLKDLEKEYRGRKEQIELDRRQAMLLGSDAADKAAKMFVQTRSLIKDRAITSLVDPSLRPSRTYALGRSFKNS